ncbi:MAG: hypothetical protein ACE5FA_11930, partial [Dehalococcoidia bacterium]
KLIDETNLQGVEELYKLGYRSRGELDQARLSALRAERRLQNAISKREDGIVMDDGTVDETRVPMHQARLQRLVGFWDNR